MKKGGPMFGLIKFLVPGVILALLIYICQLFGFGEKVFHSTVYWLIVICSTLSLLTLYLNVRAINSSDDKVIGRMILVNVVRILLYVIAVLVFLLAGVKDRGLFIFNFLALYLFYLVFEINAVISKLRRNLKRGY